MLKLGIIGISEGNGHPYSWSAICNGYDADKMKNCPYPVIPEYLSKQRFPEDGISDAKVTHIWTQDKQASISIAESTFIPEVVDTISMLLGRVDAILLARDDADNHLEMAVPFMQAGIPIYIDKPLSYTISEANELFANQLFPGQLFTCSAFQFADELKLTEDQTKSLGKITHIEASIKNSWNKYAIHLVEPILKMIGHDIKIKWVKAIKSNQHQSAYYQCENGITISINTSILMQAPPTIILYGENNKIDLVFRDTYSAFKKALQAFIVGAINKQQMISKEFVLKSIEMIESANNAIKQ